ncbi:hypothetical protein F0562_007908 [Nyssa sinensis]|uniref:Uncharacterized protein n=1 Tax=Nyssa sinensis TaxID=561372 RepID=A0A5J5A819_9ASTE|nr:hypothetical protein F0562_007908 [Nyssa sinensis]
MASTRECAWVAENGYGSEVLDLDGLCRWAQQPVGRCDWARSRSRFCPRPLDLFMDVEAGKRYSTGEYRSILCVNSREDPYLLEHLNDIPFLDTPLHIAAAAGHTHFAVEIASLKPSFCSKLNPDGLSPLHLAVQNLNTKLAKRLVSMDTHSVARPGCLDIRAILGWGITKDMFILGKRSKRSNQKFGFVRTFGDIGKIWEDFISLDKGTMNGAVFEFGKVKVYTKSFDPINQVIQLKCKDDIYSSRMVEDQRIVVNFSNKIADCKSLVRANSNQGEKKCREEDDKLESEKDDELADEDDSIAKKANCDGFKIVDLADGKK